MTLIDRILIAALAMAIITAAIIAAIEPRSPFPVPSGSYAPRNELIQMNGG